MSPVIAQFIHRTTPANYTNMASSKPDGKWMLLVAICKEIMCVYVACVRLAFHFLCTSVLTAVAIHGCIGVIVGDSNLDSGDIVVYAHTAI